MGYQVNIVRRSGDKITEKEWRNYISFDSELKNNSAFIWEDGEIWAWSPDKKTFRKMIEIAAKLNAEVIGEDETKFVLDENGKIIEIAS